MKNNVSPSDLVVHPHYNEGNNQYDVKVEDIANGLTKAGYKITDKENWWEDDDIISNTTYRLEIHRDNGDFKTSPIILSVKLYSNNKDITDTVPSDNFIWTRTSGNSEVSKLEDQYWNDAHSTGSKSIIVNKEDVNLHAQFSVSFVKYEDDTEWVKKIYETYANQIKQ